MANKSVQSRWHDLSVLFVIPGSGAFGAQAFLQNCNAQCNAVFVSNLADAKAKLASQKFHMVVIGDEVPQNRGDYDEDQKFTAAQVLDDIRLALKRKGATSPQYIIYGQANMLAGIFDKKDVIGAAFGRTDDDYPSAMLTLFDYAFLTQIKGEKIDLKLPSGTCPELAILKKAMERAALRTA